MTHADGTDGGMTPNETAPYPILEIRSDWVSQSEALGSKQELWYSESSQQSPWLFKYPQAGTGQHWAEKVAAEIADAIDVMHARVELAIFEGTRGSATESFAREGRELYHGNQVLAGHVIGYNPLREFNQSDRGTCANRLDVRIGPDLRCRADVL